MMEFKELLFDWISSATSPESSKWVEETGKKLESPKFTDIIYPAMGMAQRKLGKAALKLSEAELEKASRLLPGFRPCTWTLDETARIYFLLCLPFENQEDYNSLLDEILGASDMREALALHKSHSLLPHPKLHYNRAREAVRSNNKLYYEAIAHYNPYPFNHFEEDAWNQMVLKGLFVESNLYKIYGLESRVNGHLKQMLVDYARERWAASRLVYPELWRCVAPLSEEQDLDLFERALNSPFPEERQGGALALAGSSLPKAQKILKKFPFYLNLIENGTLSWETSNDPII